MMLQVLCDIREYNLYLEGYDRFLEGLESLITYCKLVDIEVYMENEEYEKRIVLVIRFEEVIGVIIMINKESFRITHCSLDFENDGTKNISLIEALHKLKEEVMNIEV